MARREKRKGKFDAEDGEGNNDVVILSSDDEEANEDLSLKIVEKALLKRAVKRDQKVGSVFEDSNGSSIVDLCSSSSQETDDYLAGPDGVSSEAVAVVREKNKVRKKKMKKVEVEIGENSVSIRLFICKLLMLIYIPRSFINGMPFKCYFGGRHFHFIGFDFR